MNKYLPSLTRTCYRATFFVYVLLALPNFVDAQSSSLDSIRQLHLSYVADSSRWDRKMFQDDAEHLDFSSDVGPMNAGVFPVPRYELLSGGRFDGVYSSGNTFHPIDLNGRAIVYSCFGSGNNPHQAPYLMDSTERVFFTVITVTDTIDTINYTTASSMITSRNHPDLTGEGTIQHRNGQVEFIAFWTAENDRYALVNLRLFNLAYGSIVVIAPHTDGTFRSLQIDTPPGGDDYTSDLIRNDLLRRPEVIELLTAPGVIGGL